MDYPTLRIIHVTGLALTFMGLAGLLAAKSGGAPPFAQRLLYHSSFGLGLLIMIVSGFALASTLGVAHAPPGWLKAKLVIWLIVGASVFLATRLSRYAAAILIFWAALVLTAAWLAIDKPF